MGIISFFKDIFSTDYIIDSSKVYFTPFGISDTDESLRKKEFSTNKLKVLSIAEINKHTDIYSFICAINQCNMEGMIKIFYQWKFRNDKKRLVFNGTNKNY